MTTPSIHPPGQDDIVARIINRDHGDLFGFAEEVLVAALDFEHARRFLLPAVTAAEWDAIRDHDVAATARDYLEFAVDKMVGHRGISASRSVIKFREWAWLLGRPDVAAAMDAAPYPQYGAPRVKVMAEAFGWPWPAQPVLAKMAAGERCKPECWDGCA